MGTWKWSNRGRKCVGFQSYVEKGKGHHWSCPYSWLASKPRFQYLGYLSTICFAPILLPKKKKVEEHKTGHLSLLFYFYQSSGFLKRPQKLEKISHLFWHYWVNVRKSGRFFQMWPSDNVLTLTICTTT